MSEEETSPEDSKPRFQPPEWWVKHRKHFPTIAFAAGFIFDSITLGRRITLLDLVLVTLYVVVGFVCLVLERRTWSDPKYQRWLVNLMQFVLGALFSATTVVYFKSTGHPVTFAFVAILFVAMVANEFMDRGKPIASIVWALYGLSLALVINLVVPYIIGSVSWWWLMIAIGASALVLVGLRFITKIEWRMLRLPIGVLVFTGILHLFGGIPPVPLVLKNNVVGTQFEKSNGDYTVLVDETRFYEYLPFVDRRVHVPEGEVVTAMTSVFAPKGIEVTMKHRWYRHTDDGWKRTDNHSFSMRGGRKDGWRFHSRKRNIPEGTWRIEAALKVGAVLGYYDFEVVRHPADHEFSKSREAL